MQVKICGLTKEEEATYLNDVGADYAGFVFYPKSKRNISFAQAKAIREQLNPQIQAVAVTVSPDRKIIQEIINSGNAAAELLMHRKFVLAGGLNESNVQEGMKLFSPDVVDVSSGVEVENGKDKTKINNFVRKVRNYE